MKNKILTYVEKLKKFPCLKERQIRKLHRISTLNLTLQNIITAR